MKIKKCAAYPLIYAYTISYTISPSRCRKLNKKHLINDPNNIEYVSFEAANEWSRLKSGLWEDHRNVLKRLKYLKVHDVELYLKRFEQLSNYRIMVQLNEFSPNL